MRLNNIKFIRKKIINGEYYKGVVNHDTFKVFEAHERFGEISWIKV